MKIQTFIAVVLSLLLLLSCKKEDKELSTDYETVRFTVIDEELSRGVSLDKNNFNTFFVFGAFTSNADFDKATHNCNFFYQQLVEKNSTLGEWSYDPAKFWPAGKISFFAYAPHNVATLTLSTTQDDLGIPVLSYEVPSDIPSQKDIMIAEPLMNQTKTIAPLLLQFKHALTQISFSASSGSRVNLDSINLKLLSVKLTNIKRTGKIAIQTPLTWTDQESIGTESYTLSIANGALKNNKLTQTAQSVTANNYALLLMPQAFNNASTAAMDVEFGTTETGTGASETVKKTFLLKDLPKEWIPGRAINYHIAFSSGLIELTLTLPKWNDIANLSGSDIIWE